ncbi:MspA family porin [Antrihabitans sp. YC2-6]|uniref:MspA family porin n=1 Tax=Antrihabitans sp. YC2-6 TaxID=2799498 RepID=UPI0018F43AFF|nr:MspA family porin [Antrihabitans sp. YC2-6]MBJ8343372.1 MspA family porin [Antrihabitans sp. YC2-6]
MVATVALAVGNSTQAGAVVDASNHIVDFDGNDISVSMVDTNLMFVPPLDDSIFTREWFHGGRAAIKITGDKAKDFAGTVKMGYQVGYPATFTGALTFTWDTPNFTMQLGTNGFAPQLTSGLPTFGTTMSVGNGPGIVDIEVISTSFTGDTTEIGMSAFHASVTGVIGRTNIRPWVTVINSSGFRVTTIGPIYRN